MKIVIIQLIMRLAQINGKIEPTRRGGTDLAPYQRDKALLFWTTNERLILQAMALESPIFLLKNLVDNNEHSVRKTFHDKCTNILSNHILLK